MSSADAAPISLGPWTAAEPHGTESASAGTDAVVRPTCPYCRRQLLAREDVRYERYGTWVNVSILYCGKCGAVLGGAAQV